MKTDIHIFSPGTQTSAQGVTREFTKKDLKQIADGYNPAIHEAPIRIGHQDDDKVPSWGWVKDVKMKGDNLYAEVEFSPLMEDYVKNGLYKKVSASFYSPESKINPDEGRWSLRHVAMLGAQPPAVKGLKGFAYSEESVGEGVFDFAITLTPDQVFDEELGPTLKVDLGPLESLKQKLDEARAEMSEEKKDQELEQEQMDDQEEQEKAPAFAEEGKLKKVVKKIASGKEGSEGDEDEEDEDDEEFNERRKAEAKHDRKLADKDVAEAKYDKRRGKSKRADSLMRDADQDNRDADEDTVDSKEGCGTKYKEKQGYNDRLDDSMGARDGKKSQSMKDRRDESEGEEKSRGKRKFSGDKSMDNAEKRIKGPKIKGVIHHKEDSTSKKAREHRHFTKASDHAEVEMDYVEDMALRDGKPYSLGGSPEVHGQGYSNQMEQDESDGAGPVVSKMKGGGTGAPMNSQSSGSGDYAEIIIPNGVDGDEYREGFEQAVAAYVEALEIGGDVEYAEEEVSSSFDLGIIHGLQYAEDQLNYASDIEQNGKMTALSAPPREGLSNLPAEEGDLPAGMQKSGKKGMKKKAVTVTEKGDYKESTAERKEAADRGFEAKRQRKEGRKGEAHETKEIMKLEDAKFEEGDQDIKKVKRGMPSKKSMSGMDPDEEIRGKDERVYSEDEYEEPTFDPMNKKGSTKKRGSDGFKSSDTGVRTTKGGEVFYDEEQHSEDEQLFEEKKRKVKAVGKGGDEDDTFGRFGVGQPEGDSGLTGRYKTGKAGKSPEDGGQGFGRYKVAKNGEQEADRMDPKASRSSEQARDRNVTGHAGKTAGEGGDNFGGYAHTRMVNTGGPKGPGAAVKSPKVRVMDIKAGQTPKAVAAEYSEAFSEMSERLAQLEAANAKLVAEKQAAEKHAHRLQLEEFTESLYAHGKLTAAVMDQEELVDFMEGLEYGTLEFSEGESPATKLMELLSKLPSSVSYAEIAGGFNEDAIPFDSLDPHEQALQISREENIDYSEALKRTLFTVDAAHVTDEEV